MKIAMVNSGSYHAQDRLFGFLQYLGAHYFHTPQDFAQSSYDLIFVETSCDIDISDKIGGAKVILIDLEDDPFHHCPGPSFYALKDKALAYGKLVVEEGANPTGLKEIMLPVAPYLWFNQVCELSRPSESIPKVYFRGVGSYIGCYNLKYPENFEKVKKGSYLGLTEDGNFAFNQRYQWFQDLEAANVSRNIGIVWGEKNLSLQGQQEYFGDVEKYSKPRISLEEEMMNCLNYSCVLSPTGFCRLSFRNYAVIATGSPYLATDYGKKKMLYMPAHYQIVKDWENPCDYLDKLDNKEFLANREVLRGLSPEMVWNKFIKQLL